MRILTRAFVPALALTAALSLAACGQGADNASDSPAESTPATAPSENATAQGQAMQSPTSSDQCPPADGTDERVTQFDAAPPMCIDENKTYTANITTDAGEITVALDAQQAPQTVNNFVFLARNHFYDTTPFHRVIKGFMAQGGDPEGTGQGGPGYTIPDELPTGAQPYEVGTIAMANTGAPDSGGSQFFIVTGPNGESLPADYAAFGQVSEGMDVVQRIEADGTDGEGTPPTVHTIESVTITEQ